jgi:hypothetical protein
MMVPGVLITVMDSADSGVFKLASVGSYLDALSSITHEMSLLERSNLIFLDRCLHQQWGLGQNVLLNWCPQGNGVALLVVPHYAVADFAAAPAVDGKAGSAGNGGLPDAPRARPSEDFFKSLLSGRRRLEPDQMAKVARLLGIDVTLLPLRQPLSDHPGQQSIVEKMVKRYSITYVPSRAVALFDIVGFSLLSPFEQMTQLNSLSYSLNSAQHKLTSKRIGIDFARSTTGDGFYIWNRDLTLEANVNLFHFMQLVLADNAIAQSKARQHTVPRLRACFHVGGSYEFHQAEGLNPTLYNYIVGDVTVALARIIERTRPGQILVGEFLAQMLASDTESVGQATLDSMDFMERAARSVAQLTGIELSGERVELIKCYLTGTRLQNGRFTVRRLITRDKHGIARAVYNAKANIYRRNAASILLGIEDHIVGADDSLHDRSEHLLRPASI